MIYRQLGKTGIEVSAISMGCAGLQQDYPPGTGAAKDPVRLIDHAIDCGINLFETSFAYGNVDKVEAILDNGKPRTLIVKYRNEHEKMEAALIGDIVMSHNFVDKAGVAGMPFGASVYCPGAAVNACQLLQDVVEFPHNLLDKACISSLNTLIYRPRVGTIARSILLRGKLASMAEEAIRWALFSGVDTCLLGFKSKEEIDFALECMEKGPIEWAEIVDPRKWE